MTTSLFHDARLKVERAKKHISQLYTALNDFLLQGDFCKFSIKRDPNALNYVLKFEHTKLLPIDIPMIIGNSLHNMHPTLDYLAWEAVVRTSGKTPSYKLQFPCRRERDDLIESITTGRAREIQEAGPDIVDLIINEVKPYEGGNNNAIWTLHSLDIVDKHRLLVSVLRITTIHDFLAVDKNGNSLEGPIQIGGEGQLPPLVRRAEVAELRRRAALRNGLA